MAALISLSGLDLSFLKVSQPVAPPAPAARARRKRPTPAVAPCASVSAGDWRGDDPWRLRTADNGSTYWENTATGEINAPRSSYITSDIAPYKSMITGEMITSRNAHREHLNKHGCIEVGNEQPKIETKDARWRKHKKQLHETLKKEVQDWQQGKRPIKSENVAPVEISQPVTNGTVLRSGVSID